MPFAASPRATRDDEELARAPRACLAPVTYREPMGRLILVLIAALAAVMIVSVLISALHFLFWIAVLVVVVFGALKVGRRMGRRSRR